MHICVFVATDGDSVREVDRFPEWRVMWWYGRGGGLCVCIVEHNVPPNFQCSTVVVLVRYPNQVSFCIFCITKEPARLTPSIEFRQVVVGDVCSVVGSEWLEMGDVGSVVEP